LTGNSAYHGGGVSSGGFGDAGMPTPSVLANCIVYLNRAMVGPNYYGPGFVQLNYSCTTPLPDNGTGNIDTDPQLVTASHLSPTSPCIGAGSPEYAGGVDIDGEPWASPPAIGADQPGSATGPLSVWIEAGLTNVAAGYPVSFTAWNTGPILQSVWDFGDGTVLTNHPFASHAWSASGVYRVRLTGFNDSYPHGMVATVAVTVTEPMVSYVDVAGPNPVFPYASWETAARNIQDAIGAGTLAGRLVLVTNGVYRVGTVEKDGRLNRVVLTNDVVVRSVNGPEVTVIEGDSNGVRCAFVGNGSVLSGFTLTKGWSDQGGGAYCELLGVVTNCVLSGNLAYRQGGGAYAGTLLNCTLTGNHADVTAWWEGGGGAYGSTLCNCVLTGNSTEGSGGGAYAGTLSGCTLADNAAGNGGGGVYSGTLNNCTLTGNSADYDGGGALGGTLNNCIVYFNTATNSANYAGTEWNPVALNYCCTTPLPSNGLGNITNAPLFVDAANGNCRLQSNSPCINAGNNAYVTGDTDLDGTPRIVSGTVDIGAYEYQGPGSTISYAWLQRYGLPTDGSADATDADADGLNNWQEWRCLTDPTNALSVLRLLSATRVGTNVLVRWPGVEGVTYFLERSTNLGASPPFMPLATNLLAPTATNTFSDTNAATLATVFYRVGVGVP
jgi:PKD repeat protein